MSDLSRRQAVALAAALFTLALALYARTASFPFLEYDDPGYVRDNPHLANGLDRQSLAWALTSTRYQYNWHPLTWISHALDISAFGFEAGRHHLVNAFLHACNTVLVLGALRALGVRLAVAGLVAASFALHPLRVESVAWIAERKDLLAGSAFLALLWTYGRYARAPSLGRYAAVFAALALGLAAKPTLVTAPFLLLVLDVWPLRRWGATSRTSSAAARSPAPGAAAPSLAPAAVTPSPAPGADTSPAPTPDTSPAPTHPGETTWVGGGHGIWLEKLPLLALVAAGIALTWSAQASGGAVNTTLGLAERLRHVPVAYVTYLRQFVWPTELSVFYPHPGLVGGGTPIGAALGATALLGVLLLAAWRVASRQPWWLVGGLWFLGTLVPMIGIVQVGEQAHADRYAYLSFLGLELAVACLASAWASRATGRTRALTTGAALVLMALGIATHRRLEDWRSSQDLFGAALRQAPDNYVAHNILGQVAGGQGDLALALEHFEAARRIVPGFYAAQINTGKARYRLKEMEAAREAFENAARLRPSSAEARLFLGVARAALGHFEEADRDLRRALELDAALANDPLYREPRARLDARLERDR